MAKERNEITLTPVKMVCRRSCPNRTYDCHSTCEKYAKYREACDRVLHQKQLEREVMDAAGAALKRVPGRVI